VNYLRLRLVFRLIATRLFLLIYPIYKFDILNREIDTPPKLKQNLKEEDYFKKILRNEVR